MTTPIVRQKLNFDEAYGITTPSTHEVELSRTPNLDNMMGPNWSTPLDQFGLGMFNSGSSTLSNMIVDKMKNLRMEGDRLSDMIEIFDKQYAFILALVDKLLALLDKK